ncbi:hypothetical protein JQS43_15540 [Natronosporangium hydrolyticum]|uniref:Trypsin-co-occurring domain-containing protein n=1 Tax=Natronosporangium hydrolyticum TaxID=2811111 RepID=A0A895YFU5_9ACTN|nr:CU044_2847 family protein [Natronosporangium hydrolyticum]QSB13060.1 hypothetical protein JQS43_15540 [Natronosporangium hydrolyticum]
MAATQIVSYQVDDQTTVEIEAALAEGYLPAGRGEDVVGWVKQAAAPSIRAAGVVLAQAQELAPDEVSVTFGVKVAGRVNWLVAQTASEGTFQVALTWRRSSDG